MEEQSNNERPSGLLFANIHDRMYRTDIDEDAPLTCGKFCSEQSVELESSLERIGKPRFAYSYRHNLSCWDRIVSTGCRKESYRTVT